MKAILLAVMMGTCGLAQAADPYEPQIQQVRLADLNMDRQTDVIAAYGRIERAANQVCAGYQGRNLALVPMYAACKQKAIEGAITQVHLGPLTAYYNQRAKQTRG